MADNETHIRVLIERWATAVHDGDMALVLEDHADDIVMFDVPPPHNGVRGIDAYRETWPAFFEWQQPGAARDRVTRRHRRRRSRLCVRVAALRNPGRLATDPDNRLRLTIGVKDRGRWVVTHEHHSFPDKS